MWRNCLSIAGFDGSGGAGLQADLKTFSALGCYGTTVLTALPIQNTQGVRRCYELPLQSIVDQLEALFDDITPDSIKIGMLYQKEIIELVAHFLKKRASGIPIVLDPVMISKSGHTLLSDNAVEALIQHLIPMASLITPNLPEAIALTKSNEDMLYLTEKLLTFGAQAVLLKGGHAGGTMSCDVFKTTKTSPIWLNAQRIKTQNTHGTGCTLSAAIAAYLAKGQDLLNACRLAKTYLLEALMAAKDTSIGHGHGPVHHFYALWPMLQSEENLSCS